MQVHSATWSCSVELNKQWYYLADFLSNWNFRGVFSVNHSFCRLFMYLCVCLICMSVIQQTVKYKKIRICKKRKNIVYRIQFIFIFLGEQRSCDGREGAQRPVGHGNEPKKTGARSARARTCGQNPLVFQYFHNSLEDYLEKLKSYGPRHFAVVLFGSISSFPQACLDSLYLQV